MGASDPATEVQVTAPKNLPPGDVDVARERIASLQRYVAAPLVGARLTLRNEGGRLQGSRWRADATVLFDGRLLASHEAGPTPLDAVDAVAQRLRRQLRDIVGAEVAERNEPAVIERALGTLPLAHDPWPPPQAQRKPPEERRIVTRRVYGDELEPTLSAIADLVSSGDLFHLFCHVRTNEDVVVFRRDDGRFGMIIPRGSILADEADIVVPQPNRYSEPRSLEWARAEMDLLNHRFLYFQAAEDGRGRVLYLRDDGDYGLVEPAAPQL
jgi:ribosome-associated translation inhibitor RaiA